MATTDSHRARASRGSAAASFLLVLLLPCAAAAQIRVHPTGVNVNAQGATTVFLTFGGLVDHVPVEALWCGELIPATPDVGVKCDPTTIFGSLPIRFDQSRPSGTGGFTDIMSIPPSVARRAYQAAEAGRTSGFFYVRRFVSRSGGRDEYVAVTCRLAGGGARVPFSLLDVRLAFDTDVPILFVRSGEQPAPFRAHIAYNGTGRLQGRWEIVHPGEQVPSPEDLLTEASLPVEQRGTQRRYTQIERFNVFLPPTGRFTLPGPDPEKLPVSADGAYLVLLRVEATADKEGDSSLAAAGAGQGIVHSGAAAGFPLPVLRYIVGASSTEPSPLHGAQPALALLAPADGGSVGADRIAFTWTDVPQAAVYRLDVETTDGNPVLSALVQRGVAMYRPPSWLGERAAGALRWRVVAIGVTGQPLGLTAWRALTLHH
jgi:hypothetical protein